MEERDQEHACKPIGQDLTPSISVETKLTSKQCVNLVSGR